MTVGPNGERRPANTLANALKVAKIATGEESEELASATSNGGTARAASLTPERRRRIAKKTAEARWGT